MATVKEIYEHINFIAPFSLQESYDNSGLCIGCKDYSVSRILIALDCTYEVAKEALSKGCELIVTHHPIIFHPLKTLDLSSVVGSLAAAEINVISAHTNFDSAVMNKILCEKLGLVPCEPICVENGAEFGCICETQGTSPKALAERIKSGLGNKVVRYNDEGKEIKRIAVCAGSGGSFLGEVCAKDCGGFITGDVKHDVFIDAHNTGITVFDAGHFHTENIFCEYMKKALSEKFPSLTVETAESGKDILSYEI